MTLESVLGLLSAYWPDFSINLIASAVTVVAVLWIERSKRPKIEFEIEPKPQMLQQEQLRRTFLRLRVHNRQINPIIGYFYTRSPAIACRVMITYLREDNLPIFRSGRHQIGRWSDTPEPMNWQFGDSGVNVFRDLTQTRDTVDIPPGTFENLDIVMRTDSSEACYGWHNLFIGNSKASPDETFELPKGRFHVVVSLRTDGRDHREVFRIVNDVPFEDFRLEPLHPQPTLASNI